MSLRALVGTLLAGLLVASLAIVVASRYFLQSQLSVIFPPELVQQSSQALYVLLLWQAIVSVVFVLALLWLLYLVLEHYVMAPLRRLVVAMEGFAATGERLPLPVIKKLPKEIQVLVRSFDQVIDRVEISHKKDVEVSRVKSDFISTAAHQLRTPLTGIRWALEALEKSDLSEDHQALVKSAKDKSHELVAIVGTLLDISAIESGKYKYTFLPVAIEDMAEEVVHDFSPAAQKAQVSVYVERNAQVPKARADRERVKWVLNNLIENAIRYTPAGGTVRISSSERAGKVQLMVRDSGIGIGSEDRDNIFERFYRAQNAIAVQNGGNGLGLYIARTIATDHGGDLVFAPNEDGIGTTFTLTLPIAER
ncbi:MAG: HAMP domain-containing sensor histidine kinase [Patescibacteria group bacterium]